MPVCGLCRNEYQRAAAFCPECGAPLTALAARIREATIRPPGTPDPTREASPRPSAAPDPVVLPDLEDAENEA